MTLNSINTRHAWVGKQTFLYLALFVYAAVATAETPLPYKYTARNISELIWDGENWIPVDPGDRFFPDTQVLTGELVYAGAIDSAYIPETGLGKPSRPLIFSQGSAGTSVYKADNVDATVINANVSPSCEVEGSFYDCLVVRSFGPWLKYNSVEFFPAVAPLSGVQPVIPYMINFDFLYEAGSLNLESSLPNYLEGYDQAYIGMTYSDETRSNYFYSFHSKYVRLQILPDALSIAGIQGGWALARFSGKFYNNNVNLLSGADASILNQTEYFSSLWTLASLGTLQDGNSDGVGDDPAIVVLADNIETRQHKIQIRDAMSGQQIGANIGFLSSEFSVIDLAVIPDINGDGVSDDPAVAVLGVKLSNGRPTVEVKRLSDGSKLGRWSVLNIDFDPQDIAPVNDDGVVKIGILASNGDGKTVVETRRLSDGEKLGRFFAFGPDISVRGLAGYDDIDGPGPGGDAAWAVLAKKSGGNNIIRYLLAKDGAKLKEQVMTGSAWEAYGIAVAPDQNGNSFDDLITVNIADDAGLVKLRDFDTGDTISNLSP